MALDSILSAHPHLSALTVYCCCILRNISGTKGATINKVAVYDIKSAPIFHHILHRPPRFSIKKSVKRVGRRKVFLLLAPFVASTNTQFTSRLLLLVSLLLLLLFVVMSFDFHFFAVINFQLFSHQPSKPAPAATLLLLHCLNGSYILTI
jgi:hypothetical protein